MKTKRHKVQNSELTMSLKAQGSLGRGSGSGGGVGWSGLRVGVATGRRVGSAFRGLALFVFNCKLRFEKLRGKGSQRLAWPGAEGVGGGGCRGVATAGGSGYPMGMAAMRLSRKQLVRF